MYVKIRKLSDAPGKGDLIINISKRALILELRKKIFEETGVEVDKQRLFYKGKQLTDDYRLMDYDIQLNDVIQLMIQNVQVHESQVGESQVGESQVGESQVGESQVSESEKDDTKENPDQQETDMTDNKTEMEVSVGNSSKADNRLIVSITQSKYFRVGEAVDAIESNHGAWFEAQIVQILENKDENMINDLYVESNILYKIKWEEDEDSSTNNVNITEIRPRSHYTYKRSELLPGQIVLANYNIEHPNTRGFWYDFIIDKIESKFVTGTILVGKDKTPIRDCRVKFINEMLKIERIICLENRPKIDIEGLPLRKNTYYCSKCKDDQTKPCTKCGCKICAGKQDAASILLCDECDDGYHFQCLNPPLDKVPDEENWFCPSCKNDENEIVKAGDKLKFSNKKAKMASAKEDSSTRDWGRGMACVGRTKVCTIVPKDHYGPIPGVDVGTSWKFRLQVSEAGIHRPHVAGIHGRETDGAYSLVLSGGYANDVDNGDEFVYSGSGGRDLSGNKRISGQSCDQTLTRMNKALALNCDVPLNEQGAEAKNWKAGKPVRVVRNYKLGKVSKYAPKDGNRYDGLYKVVKYYPEKNEKGLLVWKYILRRDDSEAAPWSPKGRELDMIYPPGYLEAQSQIEQKSEASTSKKNKRTSSGSPDKLITKKAKCEPYELNQELLTLINSDDVNEKLWNDCKNALTEGKQSFLSKVEEIFMCVCCQEVVYIPITTKCNHNICEGCLKRSFKSEIYSCPNCRFKFDKNYKMNINKNLSKVLFNLFPGYDAHRD